MPPSLALGGFHSVKSVKKALNPHQFSPQFRSNSGAIQTRENHARTTRETRDSGPARRPRLAHGHPAEEPPPNPPGDSYLRGRRRLRPSPRPPIGGMRRRARWRLSDHESTPPPRVSHRETPPRASGFDSSDTGSSQLSGPIAVSGLHALPWFRAAVRCRRFLRRAAYCRGPAPSRRPRPRPPMPSMAGPDHPGRPWPFPLISSPVSGTTTVMWFRRASVRARRPPSEPNRSGGSGHRVRGPLRGHGRAARPASPDNQSLRPSRKPRAGGGRGRGRRGGARRARCGPLGARVFAPRPKASPAAPRPA